MTKKTLNCLLVTLALLLGMTSNGWAQAPDAGTSGKPSTETKVTEPQTREAVRELLSELDDQQVRELLLKRMSEQVDRRAAAIAAQNEVSFTDTTRFYARSLRTFFADVANKVTAIPEGFQVAWKNFTEQRDQRDLSWLWGSLILSLAGGFATAYFARRPAELIEQYATSGGTTGPLADLGALHSAWRPASYPWRAS